MRILLSCTGAGGSEYFNTYINSLGNEIEKSIENLFNTFIKTLIIWAKKSSMIEVLPLISLVLMECSCSEELKK